MTFGEWCAQERIRQGRSLREVARVANITPSALLYIESGQTADPRLSLVCAILGALGLALALPGAIDEVPHPRGHSKLVVGG